MQNNVILKEKSHTDPTDPTDLLRCKQRGFLFGLSMEELRRSKNP